MKRRRRKKSETEYGRERREAQRYADDVAETWRLAGLRSKIARAVWLHSWGVAFNGYLAGLRRKHRKDPSKK